MFEFEQASPGPGILAADAETARHRCFSGIEAHSVDMRGFEDAGSLPSIAFPRPNSLKRPISSIQSLAIGSDCDRRCRCRRWIALPALHFRFALLLGDFCISLVCR